MSGNLRKVMHYLSNETKDSLSYEHLLIDKLHDGDRYIIPFTVNFLNTLETIFSTKA